MNGPDPAPQGVAQLDGPDVDARLQVSKVVLQRRHLQVVIDLLVPDESWSVHRGLEDLVLQNEQG